MSKKGNVSGVLRGVESQYRFWNTWDFEHLLFNAENNRKILLFGAFIEEW